MIYTISRLLFKLPDKILLWLSGKPQITAAGGRKLDPGAQLTLVLGKKQRLMELDQSKSVSELRELWKSQLEPFKGPPLKDVKHRNLQTDGEGVSLLIREYAHQDIGENAPAVVYLRGGGFSVFSIDEYQGFCELLSKLLQAKIYAVEYRLAPENPYPVPLEDCCAAFEWVCRNATDLGIDPDRISIAGDSAGGNMAAVLCLKNRDEGKQLPKSQMLIYPATDLSSEHPAVDEFADGHIITKAHLKWFHGNYVSDPELFQEPYVSPLYASDYSNLPPMLMITAGFDPLRGEAKDYTEAVAKAGGKTLYKEFPNIEHGFIFAAALPVVQQANETICSMFKELI